MTRILYNAMYYIGTALRATLAGVTIVIITLLGFFILGGSSLLMRVLDLFPERKMEK